MDPTQVSDVIAGLVERPGVELKSDNGEDDDGEEEEQRDVDQGTDGLGDGGHDHLQTWSTNICEFYCIKQKKTLDILNSYSFQFETMYL